ncbi:MAG: NFACT family protein [Clostridia bacterium]|nr:NFACT family protein [Clostridia bacterium]
MKRCTISYIIGAAKTKEKNVMAMDAIAVRAVAAEIDEGIAGGKIEKIYQPERDEVMLTIRTKDGAKRLVISANSANPRIYLTQFAKENPSEPPMFCMLMRKHLTGGRIVKVGQVGFERIIDIEIEARSELGDNVTKHLMCEIMGKNSNIMLTDAAGKITDAVKHVDMTVSRERNVFPGLTYTLPPAADRRNPLEMTSGDFLEELNAAGEGKTIDKALVARVGGISPLAAREAAFRAIGQADIKMGEMSGEEKEKTAEEFEKMFARVRNGDFSPSVIYKTGEDRPADFAAIEIKQFGGGFAVVKKASVCEAMEAFYRERDVAERMRSRSYALMKTVNAHIERMRKKIVILSDTLADAKEREKYRVAGDIVTANLYRMKNGDKELRAVNFYDEEQREIVIKLDEAKSPAKNAQMYYKKYAKAKNAETEAAKQIEQASAELEYLESVANEIERAKTPSELEEITGELAAAGLIKRAEKGKKAAKKPKISAPEEYEYMGYTIYSGKNNLQNDYLTMKTGRANDLWLHTKNIPGSHVLVKYQGEAFPNEVINAAAIAAATNSKGAAAPKVDVDYCPVSHVRKPNGAKAGMVIYEGYNTASVVPDAKFCAEIRK